MTRTVNRAAETIRKRAAEVARSKDGWLEGYPLLWCEKPFTFVRFDPAWPRAICKRPDNSECAIDIRTATPISTAAHRKRTVNRAAETRRKFAERQRRREAGEVRVEVWLSAEKLSALDRYCKIVGISRGDIITHALKEYIA